MASSFPAHVVEGHEHTRVEDYVPSTSASETLIPGDLWTWDDTNNKAIRCGADPTSIMGISEVNSSVILSPTGRIPLRILSPFALIAMSSTTTPVEATHVGQVYGIARNASGFWQVDVADTTNTRVVVVRVDTNPEIWYVNFLAANLGWDAIAS